MWSSSQSTHIMWVIGATSEPTVPRPMSHHRCMPSQPGFVGISGSSATVRRETIFMADSFSYGSGQGLASSNSSSVMPSGSRK